MVESSMICLRICDDKFPCPLITSIDANAGISESLWTQKRHQLEKEVGLSFEQIWSFLSNGIFEQLCVVPWHTIPGLCFSPVH